MGPTKLDPHWQVLLCYAVMIQVGKATEYQLAFHAPMLATTVRQIHNNAQRIAKAILTRLH